MAKGKNLGEAILNVVVKFSHADVKKELDAFFKDFNTQLADSMKALKGNSLLSGLFDAAKMKQDVGELQDIIVNLVTTVKKLDPTFNELSGHFANSLEHSKGLTQNMEGVAKGTALAMKSMMGLKSATEEVTARYATLLDPAFTQYETVQRINSALTDQIPLLQNIFEKFSKVAAGAGFVPRLLSDDDVETARSVLILENARVAAKKEQYEEQRKLNALQNLLPVPKTARRELRDEEIGSMTADEAKAFRDSLQAGDSMIPKLEKHIQTLAKSMRFLAESTHPATKALFELDATNEKIQKSLLDTDEEYARKRTEIIARNTADQKAAQDAQLEATKNINAFTQGEDGKIRDTDMGEAIRLLDIKMDAEAASRRAEDELNAKRKDAAFVEEQADRDHLIAMQTAAIIANENFDLKLKGSNIDAAQIAALQDYEKNIAELEEYRLAAAAQKERELKELQEQQLAIVIASAEYQKLSGEQKIAAQKEYIDLVKKQEGMLKPDGTLNKVDASQFSDRPTASGVLTAEKQKEFSDEAINANNAKVLADSAKKGAAYINEAANLDKLTQKLLDYHNAVKAGLVSQEAASRQAESDIRAYLKLEAALNTVEAAEDRRFQALWEINSQYEAGNITAAQEADLRESAIKRYEKETLAIREKANALTAVDRVNKLSESSEGKGIVELKTRDEILNKYREEKQEIISRNLSLQQTVNLIELSAKGLRDELAVFDKLTDAADKQARLDLGLGVKRETEFTKAIKTAEKQKQLNTETQTPQAADVLNAQIDTDLQTTIDKLLTVKDLTKNIVTGLYDITNAEDLLPGMDPDKVDVINIALEKMNDKIKGDSAARGAAIIDTTNKYKKLHDTLLDIERAITFADGTTINQAQKDAAADKAITDSLGMTAALRTEADIREEVAAKQSEISKIVDNEKRAAAQTELNNILQDELIILKEKNGILLDQEQINRKIQKESEKFLKESDIDGKKDEFRKSIAAVDAGEGTDAQKLILKQKLRKELLKTLEIEDKLSRAAQEAAAEALGQNLQKSELLDLIREKQRKMQVAEEEFAAGSRELDAVRNKLTAEYLVQLDEIIKKQNGKPKNYVAEAGTAGATDEELELIQNQSGDINRSAARQFLEGKGSAVGETKEIARATQEFTDRQEELNAQLVLGNITLAEYNIKSHENTANYLQQTSALNQFIKQITEGTSRLRQIAFTITDMGSQMVTAGKGLAFWALPAINQSAEFEQSVRNVTAAMGDLNSNAMKSIAVDELSRSFLKLGEQTEYTANQIAEAARSLALAGFSMLEIQNSIESVVNLASAANISLEAAAEITANISRAFGIAAEDAGRTVDVLTAVATSSNATVENIAESFKKLAPVAVSLGQPIEDVTAALGVLGQAGLKGGIAGTSLSRFFTELLEKSEDLDVMLQNVGSSFEKIDPSKVGIGEIIAELERLEKVGLINTKDLFGAFDQRSARAIVTLINQGSDAYAEQLAAAEDSDGLAEAKRKERLDTLEGDLEKMTSAIDTLRVTLGDAFLGISRDLVETFTNIVRGLTSFLEGIGPKTLSFIGQMILTVSGLTIAFGGLSIAVGGLVKAYAGLTIIRKAVAGIVAYTAAVNTSTGASRLAAAAHAIKTFGLGTETAAYATATEAVAAYTLALKASLITMGYILAILAVVVIAYNLLSAATERANKKAFEDNAGLIERSTETMKKHTKALADMRKEYELFSKIGTLNELELANLTGGELGKVFTAEYAQGTAELIKSQDERLAAMNKDAGIRRLVSDGLFGRDGVRDQYRMLDGKLKDFRKRLFRDSFAAFRNIQERDFDPTARYVSDFAKQMGLEIQAVQKVIVERQKIETKVRALDRALAGGTQGLADFAVQRKRAIKDLETQEEILSGVVENMADGPDKVANEAKLKRLKEEIALEKQLLDSTKENLKANSLEIDLKYAVSKAAWAVAAAKTQIAKADQTILDLQAKQASGTPLSNQEQLILETLLDNKAAYAAELIQVTADEVRITGELKAQLKISEDTNKLLERRTTLLEDLDKILESTNKKNKDALLDDREKATLSVDDVIEKQFGKNDFNLNDAIDDLYKGRAVPNLEDLTPGDISKLLSNKDMGAANEAILSQIQEINTARQEQITAAANVKAIEDDPNNGGVVDQTALGIAQKALEQALKKEENGIEKLDELRKKYGELQGALDVNRARDLKKFEDDQKKRIENAKLDAELSAAKAALDADEIARLERIKELRSIDSKADSIYGDDKTKAAEKAAFKASEIAQYDSDKADEKLKDDKKRARDRLKMQLGQQLEDAKLLENTYKQKKLEKQISDMAIEDAADKEFGTDEEIKGRLKNNKFLLQQELNQKKAYIAEEQRLFDEAERKKDEKDNKKKSIVDELEKRRTEAQKKRVDNEKSITDALLKQASSVRDIINVYRFLMQQETIRYFRGERFRKQALQEEQKILKLQAAGKTGTSQYARAVSNLGASMGRYKEFGGFDAAVAKQAATLAATSKGGNSTTPPDPLGGFFKGISSFFGDFKGFNNTMKPPAAAPSIGNNSNNVDNSKTVNIEAGAIVINGVESTPDLLEVITETINNMFKANS